jgi:superfamily II DNA/RNA helicase/cold shock CspA family protein
VSQSFTDLGTPRDLADALRARGIGSPFPIQELTVPDGLAGRDVCGRAPTGSGKTLAFGIPVVDRVPRGVPGRPGGLVLVPTRELAAQVQRELEWLGAPRKLRVATCYGGVGFAGQRKALRRGVDVLVACPGRLNDLMGQGDVDLDRVEVVVVDEADRMADMGFLPDVCRLLDRTSPDRQTFLFSATLDGAVDRLVSRYQNDPVVHRLPDTPRHEATAHHLFWRIDHHDRLRHCADIVRAAGPTIVFCRTKRRADRVARDLGRDGVRTVVIHGDRSQGQRDRALADFTAGRARALVATDVAARGIHVDDVACVVHYDPPADATDYTHRSGRTARAGAAGTVVSLVDETQARAVAGMQRSLGLPGGLTAPTSDLTPPVVAEVAPPASSVVVAGNTGPTETTGATRSVNPTGVVKWFNPGRGFGFIARDAGSDLFVHFSAIEGSGFRTLTPGERVAFEVKPGRRGEEAHDVRVVAAAG